MPKFSNKAIKLTLTLSLARTVLAQLTNIFVRIRVLVSLNSNFCSIGHLQINASAPTAYHLRVKQQTDTTTCTLQVTNVCNNK